MRDKDSHLIWEALNEIHQQPEGLSEEKYQQIKSRIENMLREISALIQAGDPRATRDQFLDIIMNYKRLSTGQPPLFDISDLEVGMTQVHYKRLWDEVFQPMLPSGYDADWGNASRN